MFVNLLFGIFFVVLQRNSKVFVGHQFYGCTPHAIKTGFARIRRTPIRRVTVKQLSGLLNVIDVLFVVQ